jgi:small-conductance mechanosensitive channel
MFGIDLQTENVAKLIQLALGPVFLLSGVAVTLSMLTARLARIVDRARVLEDRRESLADAAKIAHIDEDLKFIVRRTRYINSAIALSTTSAFLTALVVTLLFASAFSPLNIGAVIAATFVASMACLSVSFLMFLFEVRIATRSLRIGGKIRR